MKRQDKFFRDCPVRMVLSRISDKWSILILFTLEQKGILRFGELRKEIPDISQKMLTSSLRILEEDGFIYRKIYAQIPPKVEYSLTTRAYSLFPHLQGLIEWSKQHMNEVIKDREKDI